MTAEDLKKQIAIYDQKKKQLDLYKSITDTSEIACITFRNGSALQNVVVSYPNFSDGIRKQFAVLAQQGLEEVVEELEIDVRDFEAKIMGVK